MKKIFVLAIALILPTSSFAQIWVARYNYGKAQAIAVDGSGNVYVTGGIGSYGTVKYNTAGVQQWARIYNGPGDAPNDDDEAQAIAVDGNGNVYVTGYSMNSSDKWDYATVKYNSSGAEQWIKRYNRGNGNDKAYAIAVDSVGNIYVTGESWDSVTSYDYATIKYNPSGDEVWVRRYDGPGTTGACAYAIAVDGDGNSYVTGLGAGASGTGDYTTVKYNTAGVEQWVERYDGPADSSGDHVQAIAVDKSGNVYVTGFSIDLSTTGFDYAYATVKYNTAGVQQWVAIYNEPGNDSYDIPSAIAVDGDGNVYVTGTIYDSVTSYDYATVKYNADGVEQWAERYNGTGNSGDEASAIAVDGSGNVYVTGESASLGSYPYNYDYATVKYNTDGVEQWVERYNGPYNDDDKAYAIALDGEYVYVTGESVTIKYSCAGVEESELRVKSLELRVYPNPSFGNALIKYGLPEKANISLKLYDISGRLVKTIYSGAQEKGYYEVDIKQDELKGGIYFIRFETDKFKATRKLTILR